MAESSKEIQIVIDATEKDLDTLNAVIKEEGEAAVAAVGDSSETGSGSVVAALTRRWVEAWQISIMDKVESFCKVADPQDHHEQEELQNAVVQMGEEIEEVLMRLEGKIAKVPKLVDRATKQLLKRKADQLAGEDIKMIQANGIDSNISDSGKKRMAATVDRESVQEKIGTLNTHMEQMNDNLRDMKESVHVIEQLQETSTSAEEALLVSDNRTENLIRKPINTASKSSEENAGGARPRAVARKQRLVDTINDKQDSAAGMLLNEMYK